MRTKVDMLIGRAYRPYSNIQTNPVTGGDWIYGLDCEEEQKVKAQNALEAQRKVANENPGLCLLPLSQTKRQDMSGKYDIDHLMAKYAHCLASRDFDLRGLPKFAEFVSGVLALGNDISAKFLAASPHLIHQYPPKHLPGLSERGYF